MKAAPERTVLSLVEKLKDGYSRDVAMMVCITPDDGPAIWQMGALCQWMRENAVASASFASFRARLKAQAEAGE